MLPVKKTSYPSGLEHWQDDDSAGPPGYGLRELDAATMGFDDRSSN